MKIKVYQYKKCSTCRKATTWLSENEIEFSSFPIRERTPSIKELKAMLPTLSENQALELLRARGNLIKRPFVVGEGIALQGFKIEAWEKAFSNSA